MDKLIQPRILKGFRDFLPSAEIVRSSLIEKITNVYRSFGFVPIDTPVLEYTEILLRKSSGETEKQVFRFEDNGGRDVALRFDLTVPFARYTAENCIVHLNAIILQKSGAVKNRRRDVTANLFNAMLTLSVRTAQQLISKF